MISDNFSKALYLQAKTFALKTAALSPECPLGEFKCSVLGAKRESVWASGRNAASVPKTDLLAGTARHVIAA